MVTKCLMMDCWHVHNQVRKTSKISKKSCDSWWVISLIAVLEKLGMYWDGLPFDLPWGNQTRHWDRTCANLPLYCGHHLRPRRMFAKTKVSFHIDCVAFLQPFEPWGMILPSTPLGWLKMQRNEQNRSNLRLSVGGPVFSDVHLLHGDDCDYPWPEEGEEWANLWPIWWGLLYFSSQKGITWLQWWMFRGGVVLPFEWCFFGTKMGPPT